MTAGAPLVTGIDHVVAGVALPELSARVPGLAVVGGGDHPGLGTRNTLFGLVTAAVELIAVRDPAEARSAPVMAPLPDLLAGGAAGWVGWAVRTSAPAALAARLEAAGTPAALLPARRERAGAEPASWTMVVAGGAGGAGGSLWGAARPFGIAWGSSPPRGAPGGPDLAGVVVETPDPAAEVAWWRDVLGASPVPGGGAVAVGPHEVVLRAGTRGLVAVRVRGLPSSVTLPGGALLEAV